MAQRSGFGESARSNLSLLEKLKEWLQVILGRYRIDGKLEFPKHIGESVNLWVLKRISLLGNLLRDLLKRVHIGGHLRQRASFVAYSI